MTRDGLRRQGWRTVPPDMLGRVTTPSGSRRMTALTELPTAELLDRASQRRDDALRHPRHLLARRSSSRSPSCAATAAATARSPSRRAPPGALPLARRGAGHRRARARPPAATRRCSPSARPPSCATPRPPTGSPGAATPRRSTTWPRRPRWCWRRPGCSRTPTPGPSPRPTSPVLRDVVRLAGDDGREPAPRPGRPPRRARQGRPRAGWPPSTPPAGWRSRSPPGSSSGSARPRPTASRRWRRSPRRTAARARAGGDRAELPAQAGHGDARRRPLPARGPSPRDRARAAGAARRRARAGAAQPVRARRARRAARGRHRRLGRGLAGDGRPRQPRAPLALARRAAGGHRGRRPPAGAAAHHLPRVRRRAERWLDPALRFPVLDRADAELLGRDDPGSLWPERHQDAANVGTGAEVVQIGRRSTAWFSGAGTDPTPLPASGAPVQRARARGAGRRRFSGRTRAPTSSRRCSRRAVGEVAAVAEVADEIRRRVVGDEVTFVVNRNINYTNVCTYKCTFCGFSKGPLSLNLRGKPVPPHAGGDRRPQRGGGGARRDRGVPPGRHPPELRRQLLRRGGAGGPRAGAGDAHPRLHRAGGPGGLAAAARSRSRAISGGCRRPGCARCRAPPPRSSTTRSGPCCVPTRSPPTSGWRCIASPTGSGCGAT